MIECSKMFYVTYYPSVIKQYPPNKIGRKPYFSIFKFQNLKLFKFYTLFWKIVSGSDIYLTTCLALRKNQGISVVSAFRNS